MKSDRTSQEILLRQLNGGDEAAFEHVFREYYASLCFFANKFLRDREAAKDVVQEVFLHFFEKKQYYFPNWIALKSFLYDCVQRKTLSYWEKMNNRARIQREMERQEYQENEYFLRQVESEMFEEIFAAIEKLPTGCRRIFKMSYIDHLDIQEITRQLNISQATVKTQRQRAKKFLRERLQDLYPILAILFY